MKTMRTKFLTTALCVALVPAGLTLSACEPTSLAIFAGGYTALDYFNRKDINLTAKNYAAADYLVQQINNYITHNAPISTQPLTLVGEPALTSDLGINIAGGVGERLSQLGYEVNLSPAMPGYVHGVQATNKQAKFTLGGTYDTQKRAVLINLRMVRNSDGKVVGRFDYQMPRSGELRELSQSKAQIIRIGGGE